VKLLIVEDDCALNNGVVEVVLKKNNVRELLERLSSPAEARTKGVELRMDKTVPDIQAYFDLKWTLEALTNIVDNGVKYTPDGRTVTVTVQDYEMFARIDMADKGMGISEEGRAKIFARFYRSRSAQAEKGVGIGLYLGCRF